MHHMRIAAEPKVDQRLAKFRGCEICWNQCTPCDASCKPRPVGRSDAGARGGPQAVGGDQSIALLMPDPVTAAGGNAYAVAVRGEIFHPHAELESDIEIFVGGGSEYGLQIAAMDRPIGCAVKFRCNSAEGHPQDFAAILAIKNAKPPRHDNMRREPLAESEVDQDAGRVGRELNAGAGFLEAFRLLKDSDMETPARKRQRRGQPANAGAGDNDIA
jgi:hypothetical protein